MRFVQRCAAVAMAAALLFAGSAQAAKMINGAGATFPYPIYAKWAEEYRKQTGVRMNYQAIGSGGGVKQIQARTVDFGATDAPLTADELAESGLIQFPMVMGAIVPVVNIKGIEPGQLKLSGKVLADLFLGNIKLWNDPAIQALNPDLNLPKQMVFIVHRSDGSGTTYNFTDYLARVSGEWKESVGVGKAVQWPRKAQTLGGKGNEGVASFVSRTPGGLGYVEFAYAAGNNMTYTLLENSAGEFVTPSLEAFQAAAANADWENAPGFFLLLNDQPGADSWPITAATFILMYQQQADDQVNTAQTVLDFFDWCYEQGDDAAVELHYVPMPDGVVDMVRTTWREQVKTEDGNAIYPRE